LRLPKRHSVRRQHKIYMSNSNANTVPEFKCLSSDV
jgi:hypothetical protein